MRLGYFQSGANDGYILFRRCDPALALFLEAMQDKYSFFELHGIDGTIGAAHIVFNNLEHTRAAEALEHLRCIVSITGLGKGKRETEESPYSGRQCHQVLVAATYPLKRFFLVDHIVIIPEPVYFSSA